MLLQNTYTCVCIYLYVDRDEWDWELLLLFCMQHVFFFFIPSDSFWIDKWRFRGRRCKIAKLKLKIFKSRRSCGWLWFGNRRAKSWGAWKLTVPSWIDLFFLVHEPVCESQICTGLTLIIKKTRKSTQTLRLLRKIWYLYQCVCSERFSEGSD